MLTRLTTNGTAYSTKLWFEVPEPADFACAIGHTARATLFAAGDRKRVRKCDNCVLHFHDTSKKGRVAGAACSYAGIGLRLQHTQLASARTDKKVSHVYSGLSIVVKSRNALVALQTKSAQRLIFLN